MHVNLSSNLLVTFFDQLIAFCNDSKGKFTMLEIKNKMGIFGCSNDHDHDIFMYRYTATQFFFILCSTKKKPIRDKGPRLASAPVMPMSQEGVSGIWLTLKYVLFPNEQYVPSAQISMTCIK